MAVEKKRVIQGVLLAVGIAFNIWGLLTLVQTAGHDAGISVGLTYLDKIPHIIHKYVIVVITMMIGILSLSNWAAQLSGKKRNVLSIIFCAYSTVLTIPLFLTFILCFFRAGGILDFDMVNMIADDMMDIFKTPGAYYTIFVLGSLMGAVFLVVPILSTYCTVKNIDLIKVILAKIKGKKAAPAQESAQEDAQTADAESAEEGKESASKQEDEEKKNAQE